MKKLLGKTTWFHGETQMDKKAPTKKPSAKEGKPHMEPNNRDERRPSYVFYVRRTPGGELGSRLTKCEAQLSKTLRKKIKVVERNGSQLQALLTKSDPWAGEKCTRPNCKVCDLPEEKTPNCRRRTWSTRPLVYSA